MEATAAELAKAEAQGRGVDDAAWIVECYLLSPPWDWSDFKAWHRRFIGLGRFPLAWDGLAEAAPPAPIPWLERWEALSLDAKRIFARNWWPMPINEALGRAGLTSDRAFRELEAARFARRLRSAADRLEMLKLQELRQIAKLKGIRGGRRKEDIVTKLRDVVEAALLPEHARDEGLAVDGFPSDGHPWLAYQRAMIRLLVHTAFASWYASRRLRETTAAGASVPGLMLEVFFAGDQNDPCPVCRERSGIRVPVVGNVETQLPPFHPGCRCTTAPWKEEWHADASARA